MAKPTKIHTYPEDVSLLPHSLILYINIDTESKYYSDESTSEIKRASGDIQNRMGTGFADSRLAKYGTELAPSIVSGSVGELFTKKTAPKSTTEKTSDSTETLDFVDNFKNGLGAQFTKKMKRLDTAIVLPLPKQIATDYSTEWNGDEDMGGMAGALATNVSASQAHGEMTGSFVSSLAGEVVGRNLAKLGAAGLGNASGSIIDLKTRRKENPRKEQLFKGVKFRSFEFSWTFYPNNINEMKEIHTIIQLLKFHMHPELSMGNFFYVYPSEFDIEYQFKGKLNPNLPKISTCVLTNMKVNYASDKEGIISDDQGNPMVIDMTLSFVETELLSKERVVGVEKGGGY